MPCCLRGLYIFGIFGMSLSEVVLLGAVLNVAGGVGAFVFGWANDWTGPRPTAALAPASLVGAAFAEIRSLPRVVSVRPSPPKAMVLASGAGHGGGQYA
jgi:hypothetical protein